MLKPFTIHIIVFVMEYALFSHKDATKWDVSDATPCYYVAATFPDGTRCSRRHVA